MKTYSEFIAEATSATQRLKIEVAKRIKQHHNNPEKVKVYKNLLNKIRERQAPIYPDYPGRESARQDKFLTPSDRPSSFPQLVGISTRTKNPKKLKKQRALGEIG